jgi:hypothetical protein
MRSAAAPALALAALSLAACTEVETSSSGVYEPSHVEEVRGLEQKVVTFTAEGAARTGLRTARVTQAGERRAVPTEALIYDGAGKPWVYVVTKPRTFVRRRVAVDRSAGDRLLFTSGPRIGTPVVTTGAAEVWGSELGIEGSH